MSLAATKGLTGRGREGRGRPISVWACLRDGQDLYACLGDQDGVLPLGREAVILGDDGPAVGKFTDFGPTCIIIGSMVKVIPGSSTVCTLGSS